MVRNNARLVDHAYTQVECIDFGKTFSNVTKLESIRILLSITCFMEFKLYQKDIKRTILNGVLQEEDYARNTKA